MNSLFELINYDVKKLPTIHNFLNYDFSYFYLSHKPNTKYSKSFKKFKKYFIKLIIEQEESNEPCDEEDKNEPYYQWSLENLGKEKFIKEIKRLYCTPLPGWWTNIYIKYGLKYDDTAPDYALVKFKKVPSILEILYAHCLIWQNYYKKTDINHHYDLIQLRGDRYNLIVDIGFAS